MLLDELDRDDTGRVYVTGWLYLDDSSNEDGFVLCLGSNSDSLWYRQTGTNPDVYWGEMVLRQQIVRAGRGSVSFGQFLVKLKSSEKSSGGETIFQVG